MAFCPALGSQIAASATHIHTALLGRAGTEHTPASGWGPLLLSLVLLKEADPLDKAGQP